MLLVPGRPVARLIPEEVVRNPIHPTVEPGSRLPLVEIGNGPFYGRLSQIIGCRRGPCKRERKTVSDAVGEL